MNLFSDRISQIGSENAFKLGANIRECESRGQKIIKFNLGEPDFDTAEHICQAAADELFKGNTHYCPPAGLPHFRETLAQHVSQTRGIPVKPEQVVVFSGGKPPISYSLMSYVNPGDEVIYPSPGFPIYESWITYIGAKPVPLHLDENKGFRFTAEELEKLITDKTKLIFINSPSNPTGGVLSDDDLDRIAQVIREKCSPNIRIYSDEIYEHILFDGEKHQSIASRPGLQEKTILVSGHSKSFAMTGWRLGFAVLPTIEEAVTFTNLNINITSCTPPFIQEAGKVAFESPKTKPILEKMVAQFQERRDFAVPALNDVDGITCAMPKGAFYVFPNISGLCENLGVFEAFQQLPKEIQIKSSPSKLVQMFLLYHYSVATMDRKSFGRIGADDFHFLRLSTATSLESIKLGLEQIKRASKDKDGFARYISNGKNLF